MVSILNKELIGSPHKTLKKGNLFDFKKKKREYESVGECKICIKTIFKSG